MVQVLPPLKPEAHIAPPGTRVSVMPSPHLLSMEDYEYYDALGRDPLQQKNVWSISDPSERVERLKEVLQEYPKQVHRRNILFKAASRGDEAIVRCLVETGLKVHPDIRNGPDDDKEGEDSEDETSILDKDDPTAVPLHVAATKGKLGCVKILLELGKVDVNIRDELGRTPLIAAAQGGDTDTVQYLLGQGADPTARTDANNELTKEYMTEYAGADALEIAAAQCNIAAVRLLLEHPLHGSTRKRRYQIDAEPGVWVTPLAIKSAAGGSFATLNFLLDRGAYPMEDKDGKTKGELLNDVERQAVIDATRIAADRGDLESLKLLLSYQYATDKDDRLLPFEAPETLHKPFTYGAYHAMRWNKPEKFEFLESFGVKEHDTMSLDELPEGQHINIQHLLDEAVAGGSIDGAKLMIERYDADPHQRRIATGVHPLYTSASHNKPEMIRYLLEDHKVDIHLGNGRFATGPTALWIAIILKSLDCVELLVRHGGPVDHVDEEILNVNKPVTAVLIGMRDKRTSVRLETENNAREYIEALRKDFQNLNPPYVRIEIGPDDSNWIQKLQQRKSDEQLREKGEGARDLNKTEKVKKSDRDSTDLRRYLVDLPSDSERERELTADDDLLPRWSPAFVAVEQDDD
ncbi:hypothetical protein MMC34_005025 [Xylographa carneopallida]|nr:hypothetical protein [Xylographa carneopallida]